MLTRVRVFLWEYRGKYDILGANENGLDSIGVLFGFGYYEELTEAGITYIAENVKDILKYV